jgi:HD superfamily phosphohydrolase
LPLKRNKRKIFNDPVYGFVTLPYDIIFDIIEHPFFQRLRRIRQLGLTSMVYPGAYHTRFHHAIGAMHLAIEAMETIKFKGHHISDEERKAVSIGVLLHDIGHGPFSHALEHTIVSGISHEEISVMFMQQLNKEFDGELTLAIEIFSNKYHKPFLHQLISSQLDVDRLDYLTRDSFYTGVSEGIVGVERIIKLLNVKAGNLVVDEKGIYSIEKFIVARRIMYWQVYLHKTVLAAEHLLINILKRAKQLALSGEKLFCTPALERFLYSTKGAVEFEEEKDLLKIFSQLDDYDILSSIKVWTNSSDDTLAKLCTWLVDRKLYKVEISKTPFDSDYINKISEDTLVKYQIEKESLALFVFTDEIINNAYNPKKDSIKILYKNGETTDIATASDQLNISSLSTPVKKYFLCYPKYN